MNAPVPGTVVVVVGDVVLDGDVDVVTGGTVVVGMVTAEPYCVRGAVRGWLGWAPRNWEIVC